MTRQLNHRRTTLKRSIAAAGVGLALTAGVATTASAAQGATLNPGNVATFNTFFFGRTTVCFQSTTNDSGHYEWRSSSSYNTNV